MLKKISPHKAAGVDKTSAQLLRIAAPVIAPVIARMINHSFSTGSFPDVTDGKLLGSHLFLRVVSQMMLQIIVLYSYFLSYQK